VVEALDSAGFLVRTAERADAYLPGKPLDATTVLDVILAIRRDGEDKRASYATLARVSAVEHVDNALAGTAETALAGLTVDLAFEEPWNPSVS
jgi:hypothetical protein